MKKRLPLLVLMTFHNAYAEIYKWVDASGTVHYADEAVNASQKPLKTLPGLSTYQPRAMPRHAIERPVSKPLPAPPESADQLVVDTGGKMASYEELSVISPESGAQLSAKAKKLTVFISLAPVLRKGDVIRINLDGRELAQKYSSSVVNLPVPAPGQHRIGVHVYDAQGQLLIQSAENAFTVK